MTNKKFTIWTTTTALLFFTAGILFQRWADIFSYKKPHKWSFSLECVDIDLANDGVTISTVAHGSVSGCYVNYQSDDANGYDIRIRPPKIMRDSLKLLKHQNDSLRYALNKKISHKKLISRSDDHDGILILEDSSPHPLQFITGTGDKTLIDTPRKGVWSLTEADVFSYMTNNESDLVYRFKTTPISIADLPCYGLQYTTRYTTGVHDTSSLVREAIKEINPSLSPEMIDDYKLKMKWASKRDSIGCRFVEVRVGDVELTFDQFKAWMFPKK